jgi:hypothetical protein
LPDFKRLQPPVKLKDPNQRVEIMPSLDRNTFLVEATLMVGLQRKRTMLDSTDGKPAKLIPGAPSQVVRLRRDLNGYIQLEDVFNGISQNIGQQRHPMLPGYVSRDRKFGVTGESRPGQMLHMNLWDLQARRPLLTLPEVGATLSIGMRFSDDGKQLALMTNAGWTRIMPTDWLLERQGLLACNPNDVAGP